MIFCSGQVSNDCGQLQEGKCPNVLSKKIQSKTLETMLNDINKCITLQIKFRYKESCACND